MRRTKTEREAFRRHADEVAQRDIQATCNTAGATVANYARMQEEFAKEARSRHKPKTGEPAPGAVDIEQERLANYKKIKGEL